MKKTTLVLAFAFIGLISMSSCEKDRTCKCVVEGDTDGSKTRVVVFHDKKKKAEEDCDKMDNPGQKTSCSLTK